MKKGRRGGGAATEGASGLGEPGRRKDRPFSAGFNAGHRGHPDTGAGVQRVGAGPAGDDPPPLEAFHRSRNARVCANEAELELLVA